MRFTLTVLFLIANPTIMYSEELIVSITRKGAVQKIAHFYMPGFANAPIGGTPVAAVTPQDQYIVFDLLPEIWSDIATIDRGYLSLQRVIPGPGAIPGLGFTSRVHSIALQLFTPCP